MKVYLTTIAFLSDVSLLICFCNSIKSTSTDAGGDAAVVVIGGGGVDTLSTLSFESSISCDMLDFSSVARLEGDSASGCSSFLL